MAKPNLFDSLTIVPSKKKANIAPKRDKLLIEGLEVYAAIDHVTKYLKTILETTKETVKPDIYAKFLKDGAKLGKTPESFTGEEGKAEANIQCKKRSSASGLDDMEQNVLKEHGVPTEIVGEALIVNPQRLDWLMENQAKVSAALLKVPGCPIDLFVKQEGKTVTTDDSLDFIFRMFGKKPKALETLLPIVSVVAIKPKFDTANDEANEKALAVIQSFLNAGAEAE